MGKNIEERVLALEIQMKRVIADQESEKRTRSRANETLGESLTSLDSRLRDVEKTIWKGVGALATGMALLQVILKFVK